MSAFKYQWNQTIDVGTAGLSKQWTSIRHILSLLVTANACVHVTAYVAVRRSLSTTYTAVVLGLLLRQYVSYQFGVWAVCSRAAMNWCPFRYFNSVASAATVLADTIKRPHNRSLYIHLISDGFNVRNVSKFGKLRKNNKGSSISSDIFHKSQNAPVPYPTMHHFVTKMCTRVHISVAKWCIVGHLFNTSWGLWDGWGLHQVSCLSYWSQWLVILSLTYVIP